MKKNNIKFNSDINMTEYGAFVSGGPWSCLELFEHVKDKKNTYKYKLDLQSLDLSCYPWGDKLSFYEILHHVKRAEKTDSSFRVIVSKEGYVLDGWHRILKALLAGRRYIKAVRFKENPEPSNFVGDSKG